MNEIIQGDCLNKLKELPDNSIDSIVTDPPYGLSFMGKKWDYDVPSVEIWSECLRVLKPGGYLLAFAGTRTQHRMAVRIEDAGFEIRDMIAWVYGSGFPKSLNIGKAVDKRGGTTSEQSQQFAKYIKGKRQQMGITLSKADKVVCNGTTNYSWFEGRPAGQRLPRMEEYKKIKTLLELDNTFDSFMEETEREFLGNYETDMGGLGGERLGVSGGNITKGTSEWEGWGTALKPALEPITVARKPISENTVAENCLKHGVGGINIDKCRVVAYNGLNDNDNKGISTKKGTGKSSLFELQSMQQRNESLEELSKEIKASTDLWEDMQGEVNNGQQRLDLERGDDKKTRRVHSEQSDEQTNSSGSNGETSGQEITQERNSSSQKSQEGRQQDREFGSDKQGSSHYEISQQERQENGQTPIGRWPSNLIHDGSEEVLELFPETSSNARKQKTIKGKLGGITSYKTLGTGEGFGIDDSGSAARFFYCAKASKSERGTDNKHPTVKPLKLMEYLVNLVSKEGHTVLDPFCGSGTTGIACKKLNRNFIGIERDEEYCKIAEARISNLTLN